MVVVRIAFTKHLHMDEDVFPVTVVLVVVSGRACERTPESRWSASCVRQCTSETLRTLPAHPPSGQVGMPVQSSRRDNAPRIVGWVRLRASHGNAVIGGMGGQS